ncbi:hypothetical protein [Mesorhizobium sp. M7A.F.Ca.US.008.03.1.1]|uniref:hypothetical protein n=1 Tax=Mesorhizobium sp. M7A.F.Ca.US.008.03.1.1 TaxID=2496742 RepID=UPI001FDFB812|nr:hypothetical protein [Mesorhizobium sp. M7A.F.Ca.US.008.03.1.1]
MGADGLSEFTGRFLDASRSTYDRLLNRISTRAAQVGVIGPSYVGLPLSVAIARAGFPVSGFDIEARKVERLNNGQSYLRQRRRQPCRPGSSAPARICRTSRLRCHHNLRSDTAKETPGAGEDPRRIRCCRRGLPRRDRLSGDRLSRSSDRRHTQCFWPPRAGPEIRW